MYGRLGISKEPTVVKISHGDIDRVHQFSDTASLTTSVKFETARRSTEFQRAVGAVERARVLEKLTGLGPASIAERVYPIKSVPSVYTPTEVRVLRQLDNVSINDDGTM